MVVLAGGKHVHWAVVHSFSVARQFALNGWRLWGAGASLQRGAVVRNLLQFAGGGRRSSSGQQHGVQRLLPASPTCSSQWPFQWDRCHFLRCSVGANGGFWDLHSQSRYRKHSCIDLSFWVIFITEPYNTVQPNPNYCREPPEETQGPVQRRHLQGHVALSVPSKERVLGQIPPRCADLWALPGWWHGWKVGWKKKHLKSALHVSWCQSLWIFPAIPFLPQCPWTF